MAKKKGKSVSKFKAAVAGNVQQQKAQGAKYGHLNLPKNIRVFKEEPGSRVSLDILPYVVTDPRHMDRNKELGIAVVGEMWYKKPYKLHRGIGANKESFVCLTSFGKKCPICDYRTKRVKDGDAEDEELKALKPSYRNLYVAVPLNAKDYEKKPHIWDISQYLFQDKLNEELLENDDNTLFPDPEEGLTLKIRFSEEQFGKNKYAATSRIDFEERDKPYTEKDLKGVPNLDEVLQVLTYNELESKFFEYEDADEEEDEEKRYGSSVRTMKKAKKEEPEELEEEDEDDIIEEDDDDADEEDTDDSEETEEDNDDDEDEDDEEEPEEDDEEDEEDDDEEEEPDDDDVCVACKGTGKNSRGGKCKPCDGTGIKKQKVSTKKIAKTSKTTKKDSKNKCPNGHIFGKDCEEYDDCDDCPKWDDCIDAKED